MEHFDEVMAFASVLSVIVLATVQLVKKTLPVPNNFVPLVGFIVGLLIGWVAQPFTDLNLTSRLWAGALAGLSATGLFELVLSNRPGTSKDLKKN